VAALCPKLLRRNGLENQQQWFTFSVMITPMLESQLIPVQRRKRRRRFISKPYCYIYHMLNDFVNDLFSFLDRQTAQLPAAESARVSDRRKTVWSTVARRGKLGCVLAVPKSLAQLMFMAQSADGAGEPALFIDGKFASTTPGEEKTIGVTAP
jgi:hypothetical protein